MGIFAVRSRPKMTHRSASVSRIGVAAFGERYNNMREVRARRAFTLLELIVVVAIIAMLAAIAIGRFTDAAQNARVAIARQNVRALQTAVLGYQSKWGRWPDDILPQWFASQRIPANPFGTATTRGNVRVATAPITKTHPTNKTLFAVTEYWYNPLNGLVRARVADLGSPGPIVALYNEVNGTAITATTDTTD